MAMQAKLLCLTGGEMKLHTLPKLTIVLRDSAQAEVFRVLLYRDQMVTFLLNNNNALVLCPLWGSVLYLLPFFVIIII